LDGDYLMAISFRIKPNFVMTNWADFLNNRKFASFGIINLAENRIVYKEQTKPRNCDWETMN
jgi:hypothetical protein